MEYLAKNVPKTEDQYSLGIAALAAQQANNSELAEQILGKLQDLAKYENDRQWWSQKDNSSKSKSLFHNSNDVEITSYILLALLENSSADSTVPIIKWLISQRNSNGGFTSTQDTVMGLQALIKFAEKTGGGDSALNIDFVADGEPRSNGTINVNAENGLLLQTHVLPKSARHVEFTAQGNGASLVQLSYRYNIAEKLKQASFKIKVNVGYNANPLRLLLEICSTYTPMEEANSNKESNMVVEEISLPSGYTIEKDHLDDLVQSFSIIKRTETKNDDSMAVIYFESLEVGQEICLPIVATRTHAVAKQKPAAVNIYDYYDNSRRATEYYEVKSSLSAFWETEKSCSACEN